MSSVELQPDSFEIEVDCNLCGKGVDASVHNGKIFVDMCEDCLEQEKENG